MKVIDILNKIANGEEVPKKIKIYGRNDSTYLWRPIKGTNFYYYFNMTTNERLGHDWRLDGDILNHEVEIIEEDKKIKRLNNVIKDISKESEDFEVSLLHTLASFLGKINELVDELNKLKEQNK